MQSVGYYESQYTPPFRIPPGGEVRVRACVLEDCFSAGNTGAYWLVALPIDTAPESRPAAFAIGDTVQGESIERPGDIDEFSFTAAAGDTLAFIRRDGVGWFAPRTPGHDAHGAYRFRIATP